MLINNLNVQRWLDPRLEIQNSLIHGKGIFARAAIAKGQIVMIWDGQLFTEDEIRAGKAKPHSISGYSEGLYLGQPIDTPDMPDQFLNHSCDPNLWLIDEVTVASRKPISAGEELTIDYAMLEFNCRWELGTPCNCRALRCRGVITGNDWKLRDLQKRYRGHFLPYINKHIAAMRVRSDYVSVTFRTSP